MFYYNKPTIAKHNQSQQWQDGKMANGQYQETGNLTAFIIQ